MNDRHQRKRSRYASLAAVVTLHIAVLSAFFLTPKTRITTPTATASIDFLTLPGSARQRDSIAPPSLVTPDRRMRPQPLPAMIPSEAITDIPTDGREDSRTAIDWVQEAHEAARRYAEHGKSEAT